MKIAALWVAKYGPINLGSDLGNETNISTYVVPKIREQNDAWLQEHEEINQSIQAGNAELRRLLQKSEEEKQWLQHQLQT
ncbi:hypothetical protein, partial [Actinobacillus pleuropneumoniae]